MLEWRVRTVADDSVVIIVVTIAVQIWLCSYNSSYFRGTDGSVVIIVVTIVLGMAL